MPDEIQKDENTEVLDSEDSGTIGMSDEDFLNAEPPESLEDEAAAATTGDDKGEDKGDGDGENSEKAGDNDGSDKGDAGGEKDDGKSDTAGDGSAADDNGTGDAGDGDTDKTDLDAGVDNTGDVDGGDSTDKTDEGEVDKTDKKAEAKKEASEVNFQAEYEKLMAPFHANGVEMKPKSVDDVIRLMQMGANYHKKMAGLKPSMKVLKLLEKNDLLDQEKLNYLIDLSTKDPAAITKLLKDSGMDPLDINVKDESDYKPTSRNVSDTEIDLDTVLESIKGTESYSKTLNVITQVWDDASRSIISNTPHIISVINGHIADGTYDKVMGAVEYARSLGDLQGVADLDAYKQMGETLQKQGKLGKPEPNASTDSKIPAEIKPVKKDSAKDKEQRQNRKKAAASTKQGGKEVTLKFNPLEMSDEDIENFDESKLPTG